MHANQSQMDHSHESSNDFSNGLSNDSSSHIPPEWNEGSLLEFYQRKCIQLEQERQKYLMEIDNIRETYKQRHELEWELIRRDEEINRLQTVLNEVQMHVYDDREHTQKLQQENDQLRLQEIEDRRKIRDLLALTHENQPEEVVISKSGKRKVGPSRPSQYQGINASLTKVAQAIQNPSEEALRLQLESLKTQMEEARQLWKEKENAMHAEMESMHKEAQLRYQRDKHTIERLTSELEDIREKNAQITKDHFVYSHNSHVIQRKQRENIEALSKECRELKEELEIVKRRYRKETSVMAASVKEQTEEYVNHFREQTLKHEQEALKLQQKLDAVKDKYATQLTDLQEKYKSVKQKLKKEQERNKQQKEGANYDVENLKRDIISIDKKLSKYIQLLHLENKDMRSAKDLEKKLITANDRLYEIDKQFRRQTGRVLYSAPGRY